MSSIFSTIGYNSSILSGLNISRLSNSVSYFKDLNQKQVYQSLAINELDYFQPSERPTLNGLYKSIPAARAEQLLNQGKDELTSLVTALSEYINSTIVDAQMANPVMAETSKNLNITDSPGNATTYNLANIYNNNLTLNAGDLDDIVNLGGTGNIVTLNLGTGNDVVNINDTTKSTFTLSGGAGVDTLNLSGKLSDYKFQRNVDSTLTITNSISDAMIILDNTIENINFGDASTLTFDGINVNINSINLPQNLIINSNNTSYNYVTSQYGDNITIAGNGNSINIDSGSGDDFISVYGSANNVTLQTSGGNDRIFVDQGNANIVNIDGSGDNDTLVLAGNMADWSQSGNVYTNTLTSTQVTVNNVENIYFGELVVDITGNSSVFDYSSSSNSTVVLDVGDGDDIVNLGGSDNDINVNLNSGNNTVNVDSTNLNNFILKGGTGIDVVKLSGSIADYDIKGNDNSTLTIKDRLSGSTLTIDTNIETVAFSDLSTLVFNGNKITVNSTIYADNMYITGTNNTININTYNEADYISLSGSGNNINVLTGIGDDTLFVSTKNSLNNNITVDGSDGYDTVLLEGMPEDWILTGTDVGMVYNHSVSNTKITFYTGLERLGYAINDDTGLASTFDLTGYTDTYFVVNTYDQSDTVNLGGTNNTVDVYLGSGDNTVNIDDTNYNEFNIYGGTGIDTVNFNGNLQDYTITDNLDATYTITNVLSGAITTLDNQVENVQFTDQGGNAAIVNFNTPVNFAIIYNAGDSNDTFNLGGTGNNFIVNLNAGNNTVNIDDSSSANYNITGGTDTDILNLTANLSDYTVIRNLSSGIVTATNTVSGAVVTFDYASIEQANAANGSLFTIMTDTLDDVPGNAANIDLTGYSNLTAVVNTYDMNDTVSLGGTNNNLTVNLGTEDDTVNIDDTNFNTFNINGGTGNDTVNFSSNLSNYTFADNGNGTYTITNTASGATTTIDDQVENITFTDAFTSSSTFSISTGMLASITINAADGDDVFNLGGSGNNITVNLDTGNNTVNIDDTVAATFNINGGTGTDTVLMSGNFSDYIYTDNGDTTLTLINTISGATTTINSSIESVAFADSYILSYDGASATISGFTSGDDTFSINANNLTINLIDTQEGMDNLVIDGSNTTFNIDTGDNDDSIYVAVGNNNIIMIDGNLENDTLTLEGAITDWNLVGSTYTHNISGTSVTISNVENVLFTS